MLFIANKPGVVMVVVAFAITLGYGSLVGLTAEAPLMIVLGPTCVALDLAYRRRQADRRRWFSPTSGGALYYIPIWVLGLLWLALGVVRTVQGLG